MKLSLNKFYRKRGFTLIELIIVLGISLIVFSVLGSILNITLKTLNVSKSTDSMFNDAYFSLNYIADEVYSADYIIPNKNKGSLGFAILNAMNNRDEKYRYIYYSLDGMALERKAINLKYRLKNEEVLSGKFGTNILLNNVKNLECLVNDESIDLEMNLLENGLEKNIRKIIAIRTFK